MNILITGAKGFVGKNLACALKNIRDGKDRTRPGLTIDNIFEYDADSDRDILKAYCAECDFVFNLAGVNRPVSVAEFSEGNTDFTALLLNTLIECNNCCPVMLSSSIQAALDNDYGKSKKAAEELVLKYGAQFGANVYVYRLTNLFGKWCRPNYNSVVATFCNNIANDLPIVVNDRNTELELLYIDDLMFELLDLLENKVSKSADGMYVIERTHKVTLGEITDLLYSFSKQPSTLLIPEIPHDSFAKKLYSTYLSYLPKEKIKYTVKTNADERGSFTELFKTCSNGQISVNVSKPGVTKGQHWHNTKWEFFVVVSGEALIQQREIGTDEIISFEVSGEKVEAVHMLPGYAHSITNLSENRDLVTLMWANEVFDENYPDTYREYVMDGDENEKNK